MAIRKKNISEIETLKKSEESSKLAAKPAARRAAARTTAPSATSEVRSTRTKTAATVKAPAATHKARTRESVAAAPVAPAVVAVFEVESYRAEIEKEAYYNWLRRGCPHGSDDHDWLAAIEIVRTRYAK
jgi:hypothetical protein